MARGTFDVAAIILDCWHAGRNNTEIAQSLGADRKTARKYIAATEAAGMSPRMPASSTTRRWNPIRPATTALSPSRAPPG